MYKPETGLNPNSGQFEDVGPSFDEFDTFDTDIG
jgi:hypothetical protein